MIEEARTEDLPEILALQKLAFQREAEEIYGLDIEPLKQSLEEIHGEFERSTILKFSENGRIIGSVRAFLDVDNVCHVGKLIVHPLEQNKGIGTQLMNRVHEIFRGSSSFLIFTGDRSKDVKRLYGKLGYWNESLKNVGSFQLCYMRRIK